MLSDLRYSSERWKAAVGAYGIREYPTSPRHPSHPPSVILSHVHVNILNAKWKTKHWKCHLYTNSFIFFICIFLIYAPNRAMTVTQRNIARATWVAPWWNQLLRTKQWNLIDAWMLVFQNKLKKLINKNNTNNFKHNKRNLDSYETSICFEASVWRQLMMTSSL